MFLPSKPTPSFVEAVRHPATAHGKGTVRPLRCSPQLSAPCLCKHAAALPETRSALDGPTPCRRRGRVDDSVPWRWQWVSSTHCVTSLASLQKAP